METKKNTAIAMLTSLCPRCERHEDHKCPVAHIVGEVQTLRAVPVRVNDRLYSVLFVS